MARSDVEQPIVKLARLLVVSLASFAAQFAAQFARVAHAHTPQHPPVMALPEHWMFVDAQLQTIGAAQHGGRWELWGSAQTPFERVAYVCTSRTMRCYAVSAIERCDPQQQQQQQQLCSPDYVRVRFGGAPIRWRSDGVIERIEEQQQPPPRPVEPPRGERGEGCDGEHWVWAAHVNVGVEFAWDAISPRLGAVFSPGFRRFAANGEYRERITGVMGECYGYGPAHADAPFAALVGTEYGVDFRGHILGAFVAGEAVLGIGGIVPVGRVQLRRWRLPSVLGVLMPEVGYQMRSIPADPMGPRAGKTDTLWSLYLRPAGWSVGYTFARNPQLIVTFDAAPVFAVPLSGQAFSLGFSSFVSLEMNAW